MQKLNILLNRSTFPQNRLLLAVLAFSFCALLILNGCGKRKPPLPPIEKVSQRIEVSGKQFGNRIILSWVMPARNASDNNVLNIFRADIYRIIEKNSSPLTLSEEEFANNSNLIAVIPIKESDFGKMTLTYTDELTFSNQPIRLRYAIRFVNLSGQKASFSNFLVIEPNSKTALSPIDLSAKITEKAVILNWLEPTKNIDESTPANVIGYNIYRFTNEFKDAKVLNQTPVSKNEFADSSFDFNKKYSYFARTVSLGKNGEPVESLESNIITVTPKDTFAPMPPTGITIVAAPNIISIFFAVNIENDIEGYYIYRSTDSGLPLTEWEMVTKAVLKTNTFQDKFIESEKKYYYYIVAVDRAGNVSRPSEIVSETVP